MAKRIRFELLKEIKTIPLSIFSLTKLSALENIVYYLTSKKQLKQTEIAFLLKRNPRTIWTTLVRAEAKITNSKVPKRFDYQERKINTRSQVRDMKLLA